MARQRKIRYGVVGLGWIAQEAVLPAFSHLSRRQVELVALFSGDERKRRELERKYKVPFAYSYDDYEKGLEEAEVDAVYIALPNSLHAEYTVRAAERGVHVLCDKPMAVNEAECVRMIRVCREQGVKLMVAYRLHFERANLEVMELVRKGKLGNPRYFHSLFSMQVRPGNIRLQEDLGGGPLLDLGIYCINAARSVFREEPLQVFGVTASSEDSRFDEVEELVSGLLWFPGDRVASFTCGFGAGHASMYQVVGTKGSLRVDPAFSANSALKYKLIVDGKDPKPKAKVFKPTDQFAPVLSYFADCIVHDKEPEPSGREGLMDVHIMQSLYRSAREGRPVRLEPVRTDAWPTLRQEAKRIPAPKKVRLVNAAPPSAD